MSKSKSNARAASPWPAGPTPPRTPRVRCVPTAAEAAKHLAQARAMAWSREDKMLSVRFAAWRVDLAALVAAGDSEGIEALAAQAWIDVRRGDAELGKWLRMGRWRQTALLMAISARGEEARAACVAAVAKLIDLRSESPPKSQGLREDRAHLDQALGIALLNCRGVPVLDALVALGANPKHRHLNNALHCAASEGHAAMVQWILDRGAPVDGAPGSSPPTPLMDACGPRGSGQAVRVLIAAGALLDRQTGFGIAAANRAASYGSHEALAALMQAGACPTLRDELGMDPAMRAAVAGSVPCLEILARAGAPLDAKDLSGKDALAHAEESRRGRDAAQWLRAWRAKAQAEDLAKEIASPGEQFDAGPLRI